MAMIPLVPNEVWVRILQECDLEARLALLRTCRRFWQLRGVHELAFPCQIGESMVKKSVRSAPCWGIIAGYHDDRLCLFTMLGEKLLLRYVGHDCLYEECRDTCTWERWSTCDETIYTKRESMPLRRFQRRLRQPVWSWRWSKRASLNWSNSITGSGNLGQGHPGPRIG